MAWSKYAQDVGPTIEEFLEARTPEALAPLLATILSEIESICPEDTGFMKSQIYGEVTVDGIIIEVRTTYARFVEFGTSKMAARSFVLTVLDIHFSEFDRLMSDLYREYWELINHGLAE